MKPGQLHPNEFEIAILERMAEEAPSVRSQIKGLHVLSRKYTGVGSFTHFSEIVKTSLYIGAGPLSMDASILMPGVEHGMGALLFFDNGLPTFLEIFTFGDDAWDGDHAGFSLSMGPCANV